MENTLKRGTMNIRYWVFILIISSLLVGCTGDFEETNSDLLRPLYSPPVYIVNKVVLNLGYALGTADMNGFETGSFAGHLTALFAEDSRYYTSSNGDLWENLYKAAVNADHVIALGEKELENYDFAAYF